MGCHQGRRRNRSHTTGAKSAEERPILRYRQRVVRMAAGPSLQFRSRAECDKMLRWVLLGGSSGVSTSDRRTEAPAQWGEIHHERTCASRPSWGRRMCRLTQWPAVRYLKRRRQLKLEKKSPHERIVIPECFFYQRQHFFSNHHYLIDTVACRALNGAEETFRNQLAIRHRWWNVKSVDQASKGPKLPPR